MRILLPLFGFLLALVSCFPARAGTVAADDNPADIRHSIFAGTWYPAEKNLLQKSIREYLADAAPAKPGGTVTAVIVPHAGHIYSGRVAAQAYKLIENEPYDRVIMIGPSHRFGFKGVSVNLQSGYRTPLGTVPVDKALARKIIDAGPHIIWVPRAHAYEHSLEVQIPFLQTVLRNFKIIPIVMGEQDLRTCTELADALTKVIGGSGRTLLLASTDLSHFHEYSQATKLDSVFIDYVKANDPRGLAGALASGKCEACGGGPVITVMITAYNLKADRTIILKHADSGDVTGDRTRVVGYLSAALVRTKENE